MIDLPLIFAGSLVEDVFFTINGENAILHNALPISLLEEINK